MAERGYRALMAVQIPGKPKILLPHNCSSRILITWFINFFYNHISVDFDFRTVTPSGNFTALESPAEGTCDT